VVTSAADIAASKVIVAAGTRTPELIRPVGLHPAIKPVKGYSMTFNVSGVRDRLRTPLVDDTLHVVIVPVGDRLRIAGTAEFAGFDQHLTPARVDNLRRVLDATLPETMRQVDRDSEQTWAGLRPMSADGRPYVGPTPVPGLYVNAGHGQLGWTLAMGSARLLADLMEDREPEVPAEPFSPQR
jgi:D-amino-acid dehydrogenase